MIAEPKKCKKCERVTRKYYREKDSACSYCVAERQRLRDQAKRKAAA